MNKKPIDLQIAKQELVRIDKKLQSPHLLIGGLAVQRYVPTRNSKDIDLVCEYELARQLVRSLYPSNTWEVKETNDDLYRPQFRVTHLSKDYGEIVFGPKITEREPYSFIDWEYLLEQGKPFEHKGSGLNNIIIPSCAGLAYTKLISFLSRDKALHVKRQQDLEDLTDLSNHQDFSLIEFISITRRFRADEYISKQFDLTTDEKTIFEGSVFNNLAALFGNTFGSKSRSTEVEVESDGAEQKHDMPLLEQEVVKIALKHGDKKPSRASSRDLLIVVDVQLDFFEEGALAADDTGSLVEPLDKLIRRAEEAGWAIAFTRDWHPENHRSFSDWGRHCVKNTDGANFHPGVHRPESALIADIGVDNFVDGYSPFDDLRLPSFIVSHNIRTIYVVGIALEFCVLATCRDALWFGRTVVAIEPYIRAANADPGKREFVWELLTSMGVVRAHSAAPIG